MSASIFGFGGFLSALALLVVVYTITDIRYKFRLAIAPIPLFLITFILIAVIGIGSLLNDFWYSDVWQIPVDYKLNIFLQGIFGVVFLAMILAWIGFAYIDPPIFNARNYKRFYGALYGVILKASDDDLKIISSELARSARALIVFSKKCYKINQAKYNPSDYAKSILMLLGSRKICHHIVLSSPNTAIAFFNQMSKQRYYEDFLGRFSVNIMTEALLNKDSVLYHESSGYRAGLIGRHKTFSKATCGDYMLVESLTYCSSSPLEYDFELIPKMDSAQLKVYCGLTLITIESYLKMDYWPDHSFSIARALDRIGLSFSDVFELNGDDFAVLSSDIARRLNVVVDFIQKLAELLDKYNFYRVILRAKSRKMDFYDQVVDLMHRVIFSAASVKESPEICWMIQYNTVWSHFFDFSNSNAWKILRIKLRRSLYDEIKELRLLPNYKSSRVLAFCLNVMGLVLRKNDGISKGYYPLQAAVIKWVKNNYLVLLEVNPDVAESCILGSITFDLKNSRLIKTYAKGLNREAPREYLELKR